MTPGAVWRRCLGHWVRVTRVRKTLQEERGKHAFSDVISYNQIPRVSYLTHRAHQFGYLLFLGLPKYLSEQNGGPQCLRMPFAI